MYLRSVILMQSQVSSDCIAENAFLMWRAMYIHMHVCVYIYVMCVMRVCTYVCVLYFCTKWKRNVQRRRRLYGKSSPHGKGIKFVRTIRKGITASIAAFNIYVLIFCSPLSLSFFLSFIFHVVHNTQSVIWSDWENSVQEAWKPFFTKTISCNRLFTDVYR